MGNILKKSLSVYDTWFKNVQKILNENDAWFGFYSHFKKGTLHVHMNNAGKNGLRKMESIRELEINIIYNKDRLYCLEHILKLQVLLKCSR